MRVSLRPQDALYRALAELTGRREPSQAFEDRGGCPLQVKQYTESSYIQIQTVLGILGVLGLLGVLGVPGVQDVFGVQSVLGVLGVLGVVGVLGVLWFLGVLGVE